MSIKENHISYTRTGRYFTFGNPEKASTLLFALHGYGQLAQFFVRKFNMLYPDQFFVICPEGPHRFYQKGSAGRVGASWMTKEDRLNDIKDYIVFLNTIMAEMESEYHFDRRILLGFSQGGATASRWIAYGDYQFDTFLLWAAVFPPDMESSDHLKFKSLKNYFIVGTEDEFISPEEAQKRQDELNQNNLPFEFVTFTGKHNIDPSLLKELLL